MVEEAGSEPKPTDEGRPIFKLPNGEYIVHLNGRIRNYSHPLVARCTILSPKIEDQSTVGWAGHLRCFPAATDLNQSVKAQLLSKYDPELYFVAINGPSGSFIAQIAIPIHETFNTPVWPDTGCCEIT